MGSSTSHKPAVFSALLATVLVASPASACPNCFSAKENVLWAYYSTAVALSLLPFALFGFVAWYFYRKRPRPPAA